MNTVIKKANIEKLAKTIRGPHVKKAALLMGDWGEKSAIAVTVVEGFKGSAEVHDHSRDVWYVLSGTGSFILGGTLRNPHKNGPGEWLAESISGGTTHEVSAGDLIDIPPGMPHQVSAKERLEMLIIKVNYAK